jgi:hypothetical protein
VLLPKAPVSCIKKWKEIEDDDIKEDGLVPIKEGFPIKWNTYRIVPDYTQWTKVHGTNTYRAFVNADLQAALATALGNKLNAHDKGGAYKVSSRITRAIHIPEDAMVQIPYITGKCMEIIAFRPEIKMEIPDDPIHTIQRRTQRLASVAPTEQQALNILSSSIKSIKLSETEELHNMKQRNKECIVLRITKGTEIYDDMIWP